MNILRWMHGHSRRDRIKNKVIQHMMGVASMADMMRVAKLRWFKHVKRRYTNAPVRCEKLTIVGIRGVEVG